jgi:hypothetical protein
MHRCIQGGKIIRSTTPGTKNYKYSPEFRLVGRSGKVNNFIQSLVLAEGVMPKDIKQD